MDCSLPVSSVHRISQAWILKWVAFSYARGSSQPRDQTQVSCIAGGFFTLVPPGLPCWLSGKESTSQCRRWGFDLSSVFLSGKSSWTEEPGGLQSMGSQRVRHSRETKHSTAEKLSTAQHRRPLDQDKSVRFRITKSLREEYLNTGSFIHSSDLCLVTTTC